MKKQRKRIAAFLMTCLMTFTVTACGGTGSGSGTGTGTGTGTGGGGTGVTATINKDQVFSETQINLPSMNGGGRSFSKIQLIGDKLYLAGRGYNEETGGSMLYTITVGMTGENPSYLSFGEQPDRNVDYAQPIFDDEGNIYVVKYDYGARTQSPDAETMPAEGSRSGRTGTGETEESSASAASVDDDDTVDSDDTVDDELPSTSEEFMPVEYDVTYYLVKFDTQGNMVFENKLNTADFAAEGSTYVGVYNGEYIKGQGIILQMDQGIFLFSDLDGTLTRPIYRFENGEYAEFCFAGNGTIYKGVAEGDYALQELNLETGALGEKIAVPKEVMMNGYGFGSFRPGADTDFLITRPDGIATWNVGDTEIKYILNYSDSDLAISYPETLLALSSKRLVVTYSGAGPDGEYKTYCSFLDKVAPENVVDKIVITIGMVYSDGGLRNMIYAFNKANDKYKVKLVDYSQYNEEGNWEAGRNKFVSDIATGTAPDMMYMDLTLPVQAFATKGVFEPLDDYLANDPEISQKEYLTAVLDAFKVKDTTYMMVPSFSVLGYVMKKSEADKLTQWNLKTFDQMMTERGLDYLTTFGYPIDQQQFMQMVMTFDSASFMDWNTGEAKFNSQQFIDLLNFANKIPASAESFDDAQNWGALETIFRRGAALVSQASLSNFRDFTQLKYVTFGEDIAFVGFPRTEGSGGSAVGANYMLAMNSHSAEKDACWEFMRGFYLDEFQNGIVKDNWMLPIAKKQLDELAAKSMQRPYYMDNGQKVEYDDIGYIDGKEIVIPPLSQADVDQIYAYFDSVDTIVNMDTKVFNIIAEEAAPFFQGQKTAEECAQIIQSKVQLYMDENS